jgi:putative component of toxin-antitoxin plasmid stabilization module
VAQRTRDSTGRTKIQARIDRLANGNPGDVGPIGEGLSAMRILNPPARKLAKKE